MKIRGHFIRQRQPCAVCHTMIDYDGPRYLMVNGKRRLNPRYLVVGHIVSRYEAKSMGWTVAQMNALSNLRAECQACSNRSGARLGQQVQATTHHPAQTATRIRRW